MISNTPWTCDKSLIAQALAENPSKDWRVSLNRPTGDFFYDPWEIKDEYRGTVWETILNTLPFDKGEARVITLKPSESYMAHADIDDRFHLNLSGHHAYLIDLEDQQMFNQRVNGHWHLMNAGKIHTASNYGSVDREQLVVRQLLTHSQFDSMTAVTIMPAYEQYDFRYKFDNLLSPWLNRKNKEGVIDNFSYDNTKVSFKLASHLIEEFRSLITDEYKVTYD